MKILTAPQTDNGSERMRIQQTLDIDGTYYPFGTVFYICHYLKNSTPDSTSRITIDSPVRKLLLEREVLVPTDAYPPDHPWCRFYCGKGFTAFWEEVVRAQRELEQREPLNNPNPNPMTSWLDGEVWGIDSPAEDALGDPEGRHKFLDVHSDYKQRQVYLTFASHPEDGYWIFMFLEQAKCAGDALAELVTIALKGGAKVEYPVDADTDSLLFDWDPDRGTIGLSGDDWGIEADTGAEMTANEADELSWKLREQGKSPRVNP